MTFDDDAGNRSGPPDEDLWDRLNDRGGFGVAAVLAVDSFRKLSALHPPRAADPVEVRRRPTPADIFQWISGDPQTAEWVPDAVAGDRRLVRLVEELFEGDAIAVGPALAAAASAPPSTAVSESGQTGLREPFLRQIGPHRLSVLPSRDDRFVYLLLEVSANTPVPPVTLCALSETAPPLRLDLPVPVAGRIRRPGARRS